MQAQPEVLAYIGLGANLGNALLTLRQALQDLSATQGIRFLRASRIYRSAPVDAQGSDYLNAVAQIYTSLDARTLLQTLHAIETAHGRKRPYYHAPRTLDLDVLWYGGQTIDDTDLHVPHPRMHERAFVLRPLQELAPTLRLQEKSLHECLRACADQRIELFNISQ